MREVGFGKCHGCERYRELASPWAVPWLKLCLTCRVKWQKPDVENRMWV